MRGCDGKRSGMIHREGIFDFKFVFKNPQKWGNYMYIFSAASLVLQIGKFEALQVIIAFRKFVEKCGCFSGHSSWTC